MPDTTLEEARRCPTCTEPGDIESRKPFTGAERYLGTLWVFVCKNQRCKRYDRTWVVQVRPDGTIPEATLHREKNFPLADGSHRERVERARATVDDLVNRSFER
jgi:hypothetical protein